MWKPIQGSVSGTFNAQWSGAGQWRGQGLDANDPKLKKPSDDLHMRLYKEPRDNSLAEVRQVSHTGLPRWYIGIYGVSTLLAIAAVVVTCAGPYEDDVFQKNKDLIEAQATLQGLSSDDVELSVMAYQDAVDDQGRFFAQSSWYHFLLAYEVVLAVSFCLTPLLEDPLMRPWSSMLLAGLTLVTAILALQFNTHALVVLGLLVACTMVCGVVIRGLRQEFAERVAVHQHIVVKHAPVDGVGTIFAEFMHMYHQDKTYWHHFWHAMFIDAAYALALIASLIWFSIIFLSSPLGNPDEAAFRDYRKDLITLLIVVVYLANFPIVRSFLDIWHHANQRPTNVHSVTYGQVSTKDPQGDQATTNGPSSYEGAPSWVRDRIFAHFGHISPVDMPAKIIALSWLSTVLYYERVYSLPVHMALDIPYTEAMRDAAIAGVVLLSVDIAVRISTTIYVYCVHGHLLPRARETTQKLWNNANRHRQVYNKW